MKQYKFNYDYSKTLWMKMFLSEPDFDNGCSKVYINFEQALEIVKAVDNMCCFMRFLEFVFVVFARVCLLCRFHNLL